MNPKQVNTFCIQKKSIGATFNGVTLIRLQFHKWNIIISLLKATLFLKDRNSYMFRLPTIVTIKLNMKKIKKAN